MLDRDLAIAIAEQPDPVLRNVQITWGYHQLALGVTRHLGEDNVPWPAFGVWASKGAGHFIRGEGLPPLVDQLADGLAEGIDRITSKLPSALQPRVHRIPRALLQRISQETADAIAAGNQRIWAELGPLFVDFEAVLAGRHDAADWLDQLSPGHTGVGGQALLRAALENLLAAQRSRDPKERAELLFAYNALTGLHEQIRIQRELEEALSSPLYLIHDVMDELDDDRDDSLFEMIAERATARLLTPLVTGVTRQVRRVLTRHFMTFDLPHSSYALGKDLPNLPFAPHLEELHSPAALLAVQAVDTSPNSLDGTGAEDWADLGERMDFIVDLFRCHQHLDALLASPYAPEQVDDLVEGRLPNGPL